MITDVKSFINTLQHIKNKDSKLICTMYGSRFGVINVFMYENVTFIKTSYLSANPLNVRQLVSKLINLNADTNFILLRVDRVTEAINKVQETNIGYTIINVGLLYIALLETKSFIIIMYAN